MEQGGFIHNAALTRQQEHTLAERIADEEHQARQAVLHTPVDNLLTQGRTRRERTRGKQVDRLGEAVEALIELASDDPSWREDASEAQEHWLRSVELRWKLALSAEHVAKAEARKQKSATIDQADLEQEAIMGLLQAASRYEPDRQTRFPTYAKWWVKAAMTRSLRRDRTIRLPKSATKDLSKVKARLAQPPGDDITVEQAARDVNVRPERARQLLRFQQPVSLDAPVDADGEGSATLGDSIPDTEGPPPDEEAAAREQRERLEAAMHACLDERSQDIVARRYGLNGPKETLAAIGEDHGITPQRVRQLQKRALRELNGWFQSN